jgi:hypothetical protein
MSNAAPPAHYDSPWKAALTHAFRAFMEFYFRELYAQIDWTKRPRFRDTELAQIGFGDVPAEIRADKLVEVCAGGRRAMVLLNVEVLCPTRGLKAGQEKGLERGRKKGAAELLESQLTLRFGALPDSVRKKLANASEQQLANWGAAVLDAPSLKHVFK